jgi:hypothetical protein
LLAKILVITMMDLLWRLQRARDDGNNPIERVALVVEALALFHTGEATSPSSAPARCAASNPITTAG